MVGKLLPQLIILGVQVVGRALARTYKDTLTNAMKEASKAGVMTLDEAVKILHVDRDAPRKEMMRRYEHLFEANKPPKGSLYLQSKVQRAMERFDAELRQRGE